MLIFNLKIMDEELNSRLFQASPDMSGMMTACFW
jgi:hypothetical protein